jgi:predicted nucleic acid-binding protein
VIYVFDACALIAFLNEENGFEEVDAILTQADAGNHILYMHRINLIEVFYGYIRDFGLDEAKEILEPVYELPLQFIDTISEEMYNAAAIFTGTYHISLGDSIACATAKSLSAALVTADHGDLEKIQEQEKLPMYWVRPKPYNA